MTEETARTWKIFGIAVFISALIILFFSGIFPVENLFARLPKPCTQVAAVVAADVVALTNENRTDDGLPALSTNALLTEAAQEKADDMAAHSYYAHVSPDGKSPLYWLQKVGYKYLNAGENLVIDRTTSEQVVDAWMASPDHRENILRPQFTQIGVGVAEGEYQGIKTTFVVQEFGTPYPVAPVAVAVAKPVAQPTTPATKPKTPSAQPVKTAAVSTSTAATPKATSTAIVSTTIAPKPDALTQGSAALSAPVSNALPLDALVPTVSTSSDNSVLATSEARISLPLAQSLPIDLYASGSAAGCTS